MINATVETLLAEGLEPVDKALSATGVHVSPWTRLRWCIRGSRGVTLEACKVGSRWHTSQAAVRRFISATQPGGSRRVAKPRKSSATSPASKRILASHGLSES